MSKRIKLIDRLLPDYTKGEEIFNMATHAAGGAFGIVMLVLCIVFSAIRGSVAGMLSSVVYGVSMTMLYTISSVYHGLRPGTAKKVMQVIDHCTIYFMIAGTYTPVLMCGILPSDPAAAWIVFGVVWGLTALATTLTAIDLKAYNVFSMICYIGIGWAAVFIVPQTLRALGGGFWWLVAGGVLYTIGAAMYGLGKKIKWMHSIFHLFVLIGSLAHGVVILWFVILRI